MRQRGINYKSIDVLVTIDPVDFPLFPIDEPTANNIDAKLWINVTANPESWDRGDYIAALGGKVPPELTNDANVQVNSKANHAEFSRMMRESGADKAIERTYCKNRSVNPC